MFLQVFKKRLSRFEEFPDFVERSHAVIPRPAWRSWRMSFLQVQELFWKILRFE